MAIPASTTPALAQNPASQRLSLLAALLATVLWSTSGVFIEGLSRDYGLDPATISFWRSFAIVIVLGPLIALRYGRKGFALNRLEVKWLSFNGVLGIGVFSLVWSSSIQVNGTTVATTLLYSAPVFIAAGGWFFFQERVGIGSVIAILVSLIGCALVAGIYDIGALIKSPAGVLLGLGTGLGFAVYTLGGKVLSRHSHRNQITTLFYVFLFGSLAVLPWGLVQHGPALFTPQLDIWGWLLLVGAAYGPNLGGYAFFNLSLKQLPVAVASLVATLEQPFAALLAFVLFGRTLTLIQWVGAVLVFGSVLALQARLVRPGIFNAKTQRRKGSQGLL